MRAAVTLPHLLHRNAASIPDRPAFREKRNGIWQVLNWSDYAKLVSRFADGLAAQGFVRGDRLAVIGDNRPRLYAALLAAQSLGGTGVPLTADAEPAWLAQVLTRAGATIVVAEDAEQVEKLIAIKETLPGLRLVVQTATHGMRQPQYDWLLSFDAVVPADGGADELSEASDPALLLYDAEARGKALSHANLLAAADELVATEDTRQSDEGFSWLPLSSFADVLSQVLALSVGFVSNCPECPETLWRDLREIGPTFLIAPPHVWESMLIDVEARAQHSTRMKRALIAAFRTAGERAEQHRQADEGLPSLLRLKLALGELLVYAPLRDQIGLRRLRWGNTGGGKLTPRALHGFRALGINLKQELSQPALAIPEGEPAHA